jgi:hypothetical protein
MTGGQMKQNDMHEGKSGGAEPTKESKMGLPAQSAAVKRRAGAMQ